MLRAVATGEPELTQKVAAFHTLVEEMVTAALRGAPVPRVRAPRKEERALAFVLQQVWFASLIGWASGLHGRAVIVEQVATAARLLLRAGAAPPGEAEEPVLGSSPGAAHPSGDLPDAAERV